MNKDYPNDVKCIRCGYDAFMAYPDDSNKPLYICRECGCWFRLNSKEVHPLKKK